MRCTEPWAGREWEGEREREEGREGKKETWREFVECCMHTRWTSGRVDRNRETENGRETLHDKSLLVRLASWWIFLYIRFFLFLYFLKYHVCYFETKILPFNLIRFDFKKVYIIPLLLFSQFLDLTWELYERDEN